MKTRRSLKFQDKSLQKSFKGFRLNPYYEQKDFFVSKSRLKAEIQSQMTPQPLKRSRGRPPKKLLNSVEDSRAFKLSKDKEQVLMMMKNENHELLANDCEKKSVEIEQRSLEDKIEEEGLLQDQAKLLEKKRKFQHLKCKKSSYFSKKNYLINY